MNQEFPNLYVLGAPKSGTTSLFEYLGCHPEIYVPQKKEFHFFTESVLRENAQGPGDQYSLRAIIGDVDEYLSHYAGRTPQHKYAADVSPSYLYYDQVAPTIYSRSPTAKLIVVVRDPVERAYSQYLHLRRSERESLEFRDALDAEDERVGERWAAMWHYTTSSSYTQNLERYATVFGRDQILVINSEDLKRDHQNTMNQVFEFLQVAPTIISQGIERNASGLARSGSLARLMNSPNRMKSVARKAMSQRMRRRLALRLTELNTVPSKDGLPGDCRSRLEQHFMAEARTLSAFMGRPVAWDWARTEVSDS